MKELPPKIAQRQQKPAEIKPGMHGTTPLETARSLEGLRFVQGRLSAGFSFPPLEAARKVRLCQRQW